MSDSTSGRTGHYLIVAAPDGTERRVNVTDCWGCAADAGSRRRQGHPRVICSAHGDLADRIRKGEA